MVGIQERPATEPPAVRANAHRQCSTSTSEVDALPGEQGHGGCFNIKHLAQQPQHALCTVQQKTALSDNMTQAAVTTQDTCHLVVYLDWQSSYTMAVVPDGCSAKLPAC